MLSTQRARPRAVRSVPISWKIATPHRPNGLLPRLHIVAKVTQYVGNRWTTGSQNDVVLVVAAAGSGKTTVLAQWASQEHLPRHARLPVRWYHLDTTDNDPVVLLRGLVAALSVRLPSAQWQVLRLLCRLRAGSVAPADLSRLVTSFNADIQRNITYPLVLILTGVSDLARGSGGHSALDAFMNRPRDNVRLILECRESPDLHIAPLIAQNRLEGLDAADLRLTHEEFRDLVERVVVHPSAADRERENGWVETITPPADQTACDDRASDHFDQLEALCDGWITGVLLATGALLPAFLRTSSSDAADRERVIHYLAREVIDQWPAAVRQFATQAAVLRIMTPHLCAELLHLEPADARRCLVWLERHSGFLFRTGWHLEQATWRFQPFLREALLARLEAGPDGRRLRCALHARAAALLEVAGALDEALQQHAAAQQYARIIEVIEAQRIEMLHSSQGGTLLRWLELLPAGTLAERPELLVLQVELYRQAEHLDAARAVAQEADAALRAVPPNDLRLPTLSGRLAVAQARLAFHSGAYLEARHCCEAALAAAGVKNEELRVEATLVLASSTLMLLGPSAALSVLDDLHPSASTAAPAAVAVSHDPWTCAWFHHLRTFARMQQGAYAEAEQPAEAAVRYAGEANDDVTAVFARLNLGVIAARTNRPDEAYAHFERAWSHAEETGFLRGEAYALTNVADLHLKRGAYSQAISGYERVLHLMAQHEAAREAHLRACVLAHLSSALTVVGRAAEALSLLAEESRLGSDSPTPPMDLDRLDLAIAAGFAYHRSGCFAQAESVLGGAVELAAAARATLKLAWGLLHLAAVELRLGAWTKARETLCKAIQAATQTDGVPAILEEVRHLPELHPLLDQLEHPLAVALCKALAEPASNGRGDEAPAVPAVAIGPAETVQESAVELDGSPRLAGQLGQRDFPTLVLAPSEASSADTSADSPDDRHPHVRIYLLGDPRIVVGSVPITTWRRHQARDLLLFLLDRHGSASRDEILTALWPDADPASASTITAFRVARHHLKRTLGLGECLDQQGRGTRERWQLKAACWVDADEFEQLIERAHHCVTDTRLDEAATLLREALTLWRGPYVSGTYSEWILARREQLARRRYEVIEQLAEAELALGDLNAAIQHFCDLLSDEPYRESAHRGLMECYARRGELGRALDHFQRCRDLLRTELGVEPSPQTLALYQRLRASAAPRTRPMQDLPRRGRTDTVGGAGTHARHRPVGVAHGSVARAV
jgi:ATP/maltotriose-dependent transcriptional regulator MalT/DNA-binding SARP family transcriptional activator